MESVIFSNPWVLALYGWVGYNIFALMKARKKFDKDESGYLSWKEILFYFKVEAIPIFFSVWVIPAGVIFAQDIWGWAMDLAGKDWEFVTAVYILMGALSAIIQWGVKKLSGN